MYIVGATDKLEFVCDAGASTDVVCDVSAVYDDGASVTGYGNSATSNGSTGVTAVPAPGSGKSYLLDAVNFYNTGTGARTLTVRVAGATTRVIRSVTLQQGESLSYARGTGWKRFDALGREIISDSSSTVGATGTVRSIIKAGTAPEAAGSSYATLKDAGLPGAITVGTPGVAGRAVSSEAGCLPLPTPTGSLYLTRFVVSATVAGTYRLLDLLFINSGIVVTTTTAQTINSVAFPARDANGTADGENCMIGLLFTAASTNAAAFATATVTYTNSAGTGSRTATLTAVGGLQIPATPVVGTVVWFQLQAGDTGVKSIESITLATSLVTGSVSLIVARVIDVALTTLANVPGVGVGAFTSESSPGIRVYSGASLFVEMIASATTAAAIQATCSFADR